MWDWLSGKQIMFKGKPATKEDIEANPEAFAKVWSAQGAGTFKEVPGVHSKACTICEVLREQLSEARLRELRLTRQLESKDSTIDRVIASKFDRAQTIKSELPQQTSMIESQDLCDVLPTRDEQFSEN